MNEKKLVNFGPKTAKGLFAYFDLLKIDSAHFFGQF